MSPPQSWVERNARRERSRHWLVRHEDGELRNEPRPSAYVEEVRIEVRRRVLRRAVLRKVRETSARAVHERMPVVRRQRPATEAGADVCRCLVHERRKRNYRRSRNRTRRNVMFATATHVQSSYFFLVFFFAFGTRGMSKTFSCTVCM